jgi:antitoxin component of MazEF toxin-antitoxin module
MNVTLPKAVLSQHVDMTIGTDVTTGLRDSIFIRFLLCRIGCHEAIIS